MCVQQTFYEMSTNSESQLICYKRKLSSSTTDSDVIFFNLFFNFRSSLFEINKDRG